jgi:hypothetical protein
VPRQNDEPVAHATIAITADPRDVAAALADPAAVKQYLFGTTVESKRKVLRA